MLECPACRAIHHEECWHDNGGCAIIGCAAAPQEGARPPAPVASEPVVPRAEYPSRAASPAAPAPYAPAPRRRTALAAALAVLLLAGGALAFILTRDGSGGSPSAPSPTATATASPLATPARAGSASGTDVSGDARVRAAVADCKSSIDRQASLKEETKTELKALCDQAASGEARDLRALQIQVCRKIVEDTVPDSAGGATDTALEQCESAAP